MSGHTQQDRTTCLTEARNAAAEKNRGRLENYQAAATARCDVHTIAEDRAACRARVLGMGEVEGSVAGGGLLREVETVVMPEGQASITVNPQTGPDRADPRDPHAGQPLSLDCSAAALRCCNTTRRKGSPWAGQPFGDRDGTRRTQGPGPSGGKASHGYRNEVSWDGGQGRQPYTNQEEELPPAAAKFEGGDAGDVAGRNLEQMVSHGDAGQARTGRPARDLRAASAGHSTPNSISSTTMPRARREARG